MSGTIGVDAGTSTTVVAILGEDGKPVVFVGKKNSPLFPSIVGYLEDGTPVFEDRAFELEVFDHRRVVRGAKREIGSMRSINVISKKVDPETVQADLVKHIMTELFSQKGFEDWTFDNTRVFLAYPVDFSIEMKDVYRKGMCSAGINVDDRDMHDEALAAITTVAFESGEDLTGKTIMVLDVGGGTTEVCVATVRKSSDSVIKLAIRASDGNKMLGGTDYDFQVRQAVVEQAASQMGITPKKVDTNRKNKRLTNVASENYKIRLGHEDVTDDLFLEGAAPVRIEIKKSWFEENTRFLSQAVVKVVDSALQMAFNDHPDNLSKLGIDPIHSDEDIDRIVFIGGGSKVPSIREELIKAHPSFADKIDTSVDPQTAVAKGLCYLAQLSMKETLDESSGTLIVNRCRDSYGIGARHPEEDYKLYCHMHLYKGDVIPSHVTRVYALPEDFAGYVDAIVFTVVDADREHPVVDPNFGCNLLSRVRVHLPNCKPNDEVLVDLEILPSGLLRVTATARGETFVSDPIEYEADA